MNTTVHLFNAMKPDVEASVSHCATCNLRDRCLPTGLNHVDLNTLGKIISHRHHIRRGESLYRTNDPLTSLYAIQLGHFKTLQIDGNGAEHIVGFQMAGELLGMDAINTKHHHCDSVALEDSEVCVIPFNSLELLLDQIPPLSHHFRRLMSEEITRNQSRMLLFGNMRAEQRFAAFLVNLSSRYAARGYSAMRFQLRMSREDIGNYLGLTIESISRLITGFRKKELLNVAHRELEIIDPIALQHLATGRAQEKNQTIFPLSSRAAMRAASHAV